MRTILLSLAAFAAASTSAAHAFQMRTQTWATNTVTVNVNPDVALSFPQYYSKLITAESKVNANASALRFDLVDDNDVISATGNGENELNFTSDPALLCGSIACTFVVTNATRILEADVFFDVNYAWTVDDLKANNIAYDSTKKRPLLNTAMHEMLHTLGAKHESAVINIMGNAWNVVSTNGDVTESVVSEDTTAGLVSVNGPNPATINDVSVMHWKLDPATSGAYSQHMRSQLFDAGGITPLPLAAGFSEPTYLAKAGDTIKVEMTLENRGSSTQVSGLGVYWSTNSTISTLDSLLFSSTATLVVNTPFEHTVSVVVPAGVPGQVYWIGAIIDRNGTLAESNETNNAAYIAAIKLQ